MIAFLNTAYVKTSDLAEHPLPVTAGDTVMEVFRAYEIWGVVGGAFAEASALAASGLPSPWQVHPVFTSCAAVQYSLERVGGGSARVVVRYVNTEPMLRTRGGTGLATLQTDMDRNGNPILLSNYNGSTVTANTMKTQSGVITYMAPQSTWMIERYMRSVKYRGYDPLTLAAAYVGRINKSAFLGAAPRTLMLENFSHEPDGLGYIGFKCCAEFRHKPDGWQPEVVWMDRETGEPGTNLLVAPGFAQRAPYDSMDPYYGRKIIDRYEEVDFRWLTR